MALHELRGSGAPTTAPTQLNQHYLDTSSGDIYFSKGTSSSADWVLMSTSVAGVSSFNTRTGAVMPASGDYTYTDVGADAAGAAATVQGNLTTHTSNTSNPHSVTKTQVGLGNVDNTSDVNKPVSTAQQTAINLKVTANTAITGATNTKITYDSKGLVTAGSQAALTDLSDIGVATPVLNDYLKYNGSQWVNSQITSVTNAAQGVNYFLSATASGISGYDLMSKTPDTSAEVDESVVVNNNTQLLATYIADTTLNDTLIDPGVWNFNMFSYVSATGGDTRMIVDVYKRTSGGTETLLFSATSDTINATTVQLYLIETVQPGFTTLATDKLVFKISASTTATANKTVHLVHSGTAHYSYAATPLVVHHNDLSDLQGGTTNQYYHLTNAEYTGTGSGVFVRTTAPNITSPTGIVKADVGLGNVDNISDVNKPVSTATQTALNLKANLASPALTGVPTAPTATTGTNTTQIATTAFVLANAGTPADATTSTKGIVQLAGDLAGTAAAPTVVGIQTRAVASTAPSNGQSLTWNSGTSQWVPATVGGGAGVTFITSSNVNTALTASSTNYQIVIGSTPGQRLTLPDATTLSTGTDFFLVNKSSVLVPIFNNSATLLGVLYPDQYIEALVSDVSTAAGIWFLEQATPISQSQSQLFDDFIGSGIASGAIGQMGWTLVAGGGHTVAYVAGTSTEYGVLNLGTGTGIAAGYVMHLGNTASVVGGGIRVNEWRVRFPTLATAAQDYTTYIGLLNTLTATAEPTNGIYFSYARATSTFWQVKTANTTRTAVTTSVTVTANQWYKLSMVINAAGTNVDFYIDGTYVGSSTTNIPVAAIAPVWTSLKTVGATDIAQHIDYMYDFKSFTALR
jgi:hypothetical protein